MSASIRPKHRKSRNLTHARRKDCEKAIETCTNSSVLPFLRETSVPSPSPKTVPLPPTEAEINKAFNVLARAHKAVAHDAKLTTVFQHRVNIELFGRPSGVSPPQQADRQGVAVKLTEARNDTKFPKSPSRKEKLWKSRENYHESPASFIMREYKDSLSDLTREDIHGHDETLYRAMYRPQHKAAVDALCIPTLKQVNDRLIAERGIRPVINRMVPAAELDPEIRLRMRLYSAQRRR